MSQDLFLGITKKNWARDALDLTPLRPVVSAPARLSPPLTPAEKKRVGEIATVRARAESGDPAARKEWRKITTAVVGLRVRAKGGDPRAVRACQVLEETGVFGRTQKISVSGTEDFQPLSPELQQVGKTLKDKLQSVTNLTHVQFEPAHLRDGTEELGVSIFSPKHNNPDYVDTIDNQRLLITFTKNPNGFTMTSELRRWGSETTSLIAKHVTSAKSVEDAVHQAVVIIQKFLKTWPETRNISVSGNWTSHNMRYASSRLRRAFQSDDSGSEVESLLGEFVGDEARTACEAGGAEREACARVQGAYSLLGGWGGHSNRRSRRLRRLVERSARGDAAASAKLQQVTARLTQRSQAGDQRAAALLQQVQSWTTTYQTQLAPTTTPTPSYGPPYPAPSYGPPYPANVPSTTTAPVPGPATAANVTYPSPQSYDDDSFGADKRNTGEVDDY